MCPETLHEMLIITVNANANRCVIQGGIFTPCRGVKWKEYTRHIVQGVRMIK